jgi:DNA-binding LacI/PurR family transcriptional regulator
VSDKLTTQISSRAPTMRDIARACGVNQSTVSRALQRDKRFSPEKIERINRVAESLGYDLMRNQAAQRLSNIRHGHSVLNNTVGLFFHHSGLGQSAYFTRLHQGILHAITEVDFEIYTSDENKVFTTGELPSAYRRGEIDGVLAITEQRWWDETLELLRKEFNFQRRPIIGLVEPLQDASSVHPDNFGAGRDIAEHLLDLGHRYLMHFHNENSEAGSAHGNRLAAFKESFSQRGLDPARHLIHGPTRKDDPHFTGNDVIKALKEYPRITAIVAHDDEQAVRIYRTLIEAGYRVPQDMSLISYDDTEVIMDEHGHNILTTSRLPLFEIGRQGTLLLIQRILGEEPADRNIELPTELIVRASTGPVMG